MKKLEDLKTEIMNNQINNFYVFFGDDYGIRKHYINKISESFKKVSYLNTCEDVFAILKSKNLFNIKQLLVVYDDLDFAKSSQTNIQSLISKLTDYTCILIYDSSFTSSTLYKMFGDYITEFQAVQTGIAKEFIQDEISLIDTDVEELAYNCDNLYNNILLETDKVKAYSLAKNLSQQNAYETLYSKNQLIKKPDEFDSNLFMNAVLTGDYTNLAYLVSVAEMDTTKFLFTIMSMFFDFIISGIIKKYGYKEGSTKAYNYGLYWGRIKELRDLDIIYDDEGLFERAYQVARIDELIKSGKLSKDDVVDYFIVNVI